MNSSADSRFIEASTSGVAWAAIIGGALAAAAVTLILLMLGSSLGLSSVSPWHAGAGSVSVFTVKAAIWLIVVQWIASGIGGYMTGRLRTKWVGLHTDEVFFRDTAHGFLAWAVATVAAASLLTSATAAAVNSGVRAATITITSGTVTDLNHGAQSNPRDEGIADLYGYYIDSLFRTASPAATAQDLRAESSRILVTDLKNGAVPDVDRAYLTQLVSAHTGLSRADAARRVDDVVAQLTAAREKAVNDAEAARKTAMHVSLYLFLSLLIGAFIASSAAALGGRHRDEF